MEKVKTGRGGAFCGQHRPLEMQRLSGVHRGLRPWCPAGAGSRTARCYKPCNSVSISWACCRYTGALCRRRHQARGRDQALAARPRQLLLHHRWPWCLPRLWRSDCHSTGDGDESGDDRQTSARSHPRTRSTAGGPERQVRRAGAAASDEATACGPGCGTLERRLYYFESGPSGNGPSGAVIANSTGCSSVYASTFPLQLRTTIRGSTACSRTRSPWPRASSKASRRKPSPMCARSGWPGWSWPMPTKRQDA